MENYNEESFSAPTETQPSDIGLMLESEVSTEVNEIHFAGSGVRYHSKPAESILLAARSTGIVIPSACAFGVCGTCKVKKLQGSVDMRHSGGISKNEINDGYILACCSYPLGNVSIEA